MNLSRPYLHTVRTIIEQLFSHFCQYCHYSSTMDYRALHKSAALDSWQHSRIGKAWYVNVRYLERTTWWMTSACSLTIIQITKQTSKQYLCMLGQVWCSILHSDSQGLMTYSGFAARKVLACSHAGAPSQDVPLKIALSNVFSFTEPDQTYELNILQHLHTIH